MWQGADLASMARHGGDGPETTATLFHWACPVCPKSALVEAETQSEAREPLIRHLRYSDGDGHGAHDAMPEVMSIHAMDDYIDPAE